MANLMIYGATGYTGQLCVEHAVETGLRPVIAGRSEASTSKIATPLGLEFRAFDLADPSRIAKALDGIDAVLHCAGPFRNTAAPMVQGCLNAGCHYLDITGEPDVFISHLARDGEARDKGVMILPGAGFDVVPTDCVSAMLKAALPEVTEITLGFAGMTQPSRGSLRTVLNDVGDPPMLLRGGDLQPFPDASTIRMDFGDGPEEAFATTWGDLITAPVSTGVENIAVYMVPPVSAKPLLKMPQWGKNLLGSRLGQKVLNWYIDRQPAGPDADNLATGRARIFGRAEAPDGNTVDCLIETPEAYALTAISAIELLRRAGESAQPGFQTPSKFAGAEFVLELPGVRRLAEEAAKG